VPSPNFWSCFVFFAILGCSLCLTLCQIFTHALCTRTNELCCYLWNYCVPVPSQTANAIASCAFCQLSNPGEAWSQFDGNPISQRLGWNYDSRSSTKTYCEPCLRFVRKGLPYFLNRCRCFKHRPFLYDGCSQCKQGFRFVPQSV
jgi:hypothetical protein